MSNFLSVKHLTFYGTIITFVLVLSSFITNYGESHLKAPTKIAGRYRLSANNLPGCLKADTLILTIEQSGIYLSGTLLSEKEAAQAAMAAKEKPSLTGLWQQQLELSGVPSHLEACRGIVPEPVVRIQGTVNQSTLKGMIWLASVPADVDFVAQREEEPKTKE